MNAQLRHVDIPYTGSVDNGLGLGADEATSQAIALQTDNPDERIVSVESITKLGRACARVWIVKQ